jgi:heme exporter protein A
MELIANNLACERGGRTVFEGLSLSLTSGQLLVLRGRNGAGKTTLLRLIAGLGTIAGGELTLDGGHDELTIGQQCHFIAHQDAAKPALSVEENLQFWSGFLGGGDMATALAAFDLSHLAPFSAALLSAGQKRRLALSRLALIARPLWLLDEPSVGLDHASGDRLCTAMRNHLEHGGLIIATTHVDLGIEPDLVFDFDTEVARS